MKTVGVSNFTTKQLEPLLKNATVPPLLDQLEYHPRFFDRGLQEYCANHGILVEAWSPLMQGAVPLPKTRTPHRMVENISIFDFELGDDGWVENVSIENVTMHTGVRAGNWWGKGEPLVICAAESSGRIERVCVRGPSHELFGRVIDLEPVGTRPAPPDRAP